MHPVIKKMQYKAQEVLVLNAPPEFKPVLQAFPATVDHEVRQQYGFIAVFVYQMADFEKWLNPAIEALKNDGLLWVCYPKKSSKNYKSDINRDCGWAPLAARGFEGVRMIAIDADWSALRFREADNIPVMKRSFAISEKGRKRTS